MSEPGPALYDLYVLSTSPYSTKARAMCAYKRVPVRVRTENLVTRYAVLKRRTGHTMVPVLAAARFALHDSTRIARYLEEAHPDPPLHDPDPRRAALGRLLEQLGDEWLVRVMLFVRWTDPETAAHSARLAGQDLAAGLPVLRQALARVVPRFLQPRLRDVGVREENRAALLGSLAALLEALEPVLARSSFVLGARPTLADFGLYGPLWQMRSDPAGARLLPGDGSAVARWLGSLDEIALGGEPPPIGRPMEGLALHAPLLRVYAESWLRFAVGTCEALRARSPEAAIETPWGSFCARAGRYAEGCLKDDLAAVEGALTRAGDLLGEADLEAPLWRELERLAAGAARDVLRPFPRLWARLIRSAPG
jgi:glutathione S-transferase